MQELWKEITVFGDGEYAVSNFGRVKSFKSGKSKILAICHSKNRYDNVCLYSRVLDKRKTFSIHFLVAVEFLNYEPTGVIDGNSLTINHIDGVKSNNHISNLELVTHRENCSVCHRVNQDTVSSKYVGVSWHKNHNRWQSQIRINGKLKYLGLYYNEEDASNAYQKALNKLNNIAIY